MERFQPTDLINDPRFQLAVELFNQADWYPAHDAFEELWHETSGQARQTIQGVLQVAVAQLHLQRGNRRGATLLYGEGLGRLKALGTPSGESLATASAGTGSRRLHCPRPDL